MARRSCSAPLLCGARISALLVWQHATALLFPRAVTIAAAADAIAERTGVVVAHPMGPEMAGHVDTARATIGEELLAALVLAGRAMSPGDVLTMIAG